MTTKKIKYVLNFTSYIFSSITILLILSFPIKHPFSFIEINNSTYFNYHLPINNLSPNTQVIIKEKDMYLIETYLTKDVCNSRIITSSHELPFSSYIGKVILILPFLIPFKLIFNICFTILALLIPFCFYKLNELKHSLNIKHTKYSLSKTNSKEHQSLHS